MNWLLLPTDDTVRLNGALGRSTVSASVEGTERPLASRALTR
jgi:hypothetical protein